MQGEQSPASHSDDATRDKAEQEAVLSAMHEEEDEQEAEAAAQQQEEALAAAAAYQMEEGWEEEEAEEAEIEQQPALCRRRRRTNPQPLPPPPPSFLYSAHPSRFPLPTPRASPPKPELGELEEAPTFAELNARRTAQLLKDAERDREVGGVGWGAVAVPWRCVCSCVRVFAH